MKIIVPIKQVPTTESAPDIAPDGISLNENDINWVMNPYDEIAVETALQMTEQNEGSVTLISAGPERVQDVLRTGLAMGADNAVRIDLPVSGNTDSFRTARILADFIKTENPDLIICGQKAVDYDFGITGIAVSEFLGIPGIPLVTKIVSLTDQSLVCRRETDGGYDVIETSLPALITVQRGIHEPRFTSLKGIMKARKKTIKVVTPDITDLNLNNVSLSTPVSMSFPEERKSAQMIEGETDAEKVDSLVQILRDKEKII